MEQFQSRKEVRSAKVLGTENLEAWRPEPFGKSNDGLSQLPEHHAHQGRKTRMELHLGELHKRNLRLWPGRAVLV